MLHIIKQAVGVLNYVPTILFFIIKTVPTPLAFIYICLFFWQACSGGTGLVHLTLNKTIRKQLFEMVFGELNAQKNAVFTIPTQMALPSEKSAMTFLKR
ncbi:hypothetical protein L596_019380 [Steinernema carpocapsae]|uniref:Uncharacterized protein n=1 Tax=Steinernema carpocapsae TaxID=34508 RepID=A0A4U5MQC8_STECR|nr:hypothetical protein L596_019380 [Steinernema carpocapsae]